MKNIARFEVGESIAILVNTALAVFWMVQLSYSQLGLVGGVWHELDWMMKEQMKNGD